MEICDDPDVQEEIGGFWNDIVDIPMCSDTCPCSTAEFEAGEYHLMDDDQLEDFSRSSVSVGQGSTVIPSAVDIA